MIQLFQYSLAISVALITLWLIYRLVVANTKNFRLNRTVLIIIYIVSLLCSLLPYAADMVTPEVVSSEPAGTINIQTALSFRTIHLLSLVWISGATACLLLTTIGLIRIMILKRMCEKVRRDDITVYLSDNPVAPFSIGNFMIMSRNDMKDDSDMILLHEKGHISNHHTFDLLIAQIFVIMCWYNPVAWLMREELKAVHEYQADDYVLRNGCDSRAYQLFLINRTVNSGFPSIANHLNHIQIRERISMMNSPLEVKSGVKPRYLALLIGVFCAVFLLTSTPLRSMIRPLNPALNTASGKVDKKEIDMEIFVDGTRVANSELKTIPSSEIKAITVNKQKNRIDIE
ncbi:MAG: M56 family metallopeptidase, partial [Muribaculaceae bacterium]|nr:M56 family metallopeptidase [Muribaculaceae bacterium]